MPSTPVEAGLSTTGYTYNAANCLTSVGGVAVTSDANGCITGYGNDAYTWDVRGRLSALVRPGLTCLCNYDPFGLRSSDNLNGTTTSFLLDGASCVAETSGGLQTNTLHGPRIDEPLARDGLFFTPNHERSTTTLTDASGAVRQQYHYSPYGESSALFLQGPSAPFEFTGRENDGTGLYYNRGRYYAPQWGRFLSEDPIGFAGGLNQYGRSPRTRI